MRGSRLPVDPRDDPEARPIHRRRLRRRVEAVRGVWFVGLPALLWGFQLYLMEILSIVWFPFPEMREIWLSRSGPWPSYFQANVVVAAALLAVSALSAMQAFRRTPRSRGDLLTGVAVLVFVAGFCFRLAWFRTHYLEAASFAGAGEPFDSKRSYVGLVVGVSPPRVLLESCEEVAIELPSAADPSELVWVEESRARFTNERRLEIVSYLEYDDLCAMLREYVRSQPRSGCLTKRCL